MQAQADKILKEQEDLISSVCGEVTDSDDDISNTNAQNKVVAGVIDAYTKSKLDKQKSSVKALTTVTEDSVTRNVTFSPTFPNTCTLYRLTESVLDSMKINSLLIIVHTLSIVYYDLISSQPSFNPDPNPN